MHDVQSRPISMIWQAANASTQAESLMGTVGSLLQLMSGAHLF